MEERGGEGDIVVAVGGVVVRSGAWMVTLADIVDLALYILGMEVVETCMEVVETCMEMWSVFTEVNGTSVDTDVCVMVTESAPVFM